jgi:cytochrome c553
MTALSRPLALLAFLLAGAPLAASAELPADRGAQLFQLCVQCHGEDAGGNPMALAPAIAGMDEWYLKAQLLKFKNGLRGTHPDDVAGMRMRPMAMSLMNDENVAAVAAYVAALPRVAPKVTVEGGDAARGQALYAPCTACHGPDAAGIQAVDGAPLRASSDWYLLKQLHNYRAGIRGTNPADPAGMRMRPMSMVLPDEQALRDVVAYITTLAEAQAPR